MYAFKRECNKKFNILVRFSKYTEDERRYGKRERNDANVYLFTSKYASSSIQLGNSIIEFDESVAPKLNRVRFNFKRDTEQYPCFN